MGAFDDFCALAFTNGNPYGFDDSDAKYMHNFTLSDEDDLTLTVLMRQDSLEEFDGYEPLSLEPEDDGPDKRCTDLFSKLTDDCQDGESGSLEGGMLYHKCAIWAWDAYYP